MVIPGLVGPSYRSQSPSADPELCMNQYVEPMESPGARVAGVLYPCPGFTAFIDFAPGPIRAEFFTADGRYFVISFTTLWEGFSNGTKVSRGSVAIDRHPAQIVTNGAAGHQLFIASGDVGYCYDLNTNTLTTEIASGCSQVGYLSNRFIALDPVTNQFQISSLNDGTSWPGLFVQRSLAPDPWVLMLIVDSRILLVGTQTGEWWAPDETAFPVPFSPIPGALFQQGCAAAFSGRVCDGVVAWIGRNAQGIGTVVAVNGYSTTKISTYAVDYALQSYGDLSDCVGWSYQDQGHPWILFNFVSAQATWAVDVKTGLWHQRGFWDTTRSEYQASRVQCHVYGFSKHLVGDRHNGMVYEQSITIATDVDGTGMRRERIFRGLQADQRLVNYPALQIDLQPGIGTQTGQGYDPQVMLQCSRDAGFTWDSERWVSAGRVGRYLARARWLILGQARNMVFRVVVSDPVTPWAFLQCIADPDPIVGTS